MLLVSFTLFMSFFYVPALNRRVQFGSSMTFLRSGSQLSIKEGSVSVLGRTFPDLFRFGHKVLEPWRRQSSNAQKQLVLIENAAQIVERCQPKWTFSF